MEVTLDVVGAGLLALWLLLVVAAIIWHGR